MSTLYANGPGVVTRERDDSTYVPAIATTSAVFVGAFNWGPVDQIQQIASEDDLVKTFYRPTNELFVDFFVASTYLNSSRNLKTVRMVGPAAKNAVDQGAGIEIYNDVHYDNQAANFGSSVFAAKYPGSLGNDLKVLLADKGSFNASSELFLSAATGTFLLDETVTASNGATGRVVQVKSGSIRVVKDSSVATPFTASTTVTGTTSVASGNIASITPVDAWTYKDLFDTEPGVTELHAVIVDTIGKFSTAPGTVLERFAYLSKNATDTYTDGSAAYYKTVFNRNSLYVWSTAGIGNSLSFTLQGGADDNAPSDGTIQQGYRKYSNPDKIDATLVIGGAASLSTANFLINNIGEARKDCVVFLSPPKSAVVNNVGNEVRDIIKFRNALPSTSYAFLDNNWIYVYDQYNDAYRWIPANGAVAGCAAYTDQETESWYSIAGYSRGKIRGAIKLSFNAEKPEIGEMYKNGINSIISEDGEGIILFGDKTLYNRPSAFDRINVRRLFNVLKTEIRRAAKYSLFEFNDEITRAQFRNMIDPYLRDVKGRRGMYDYKIVCDERNNTPEVIDRNEFRGTIFIKPAKSINEIILDFVATRTGANFEELVA